MKKKKKDKKWYILCFIALILGGVSFTMVVYAAVTQTLKITGSAKVQGPEWNIHFENLKEAVTTGNGQENEKPTLKDTAINNIDIVFSGGGSVSYEFDVKNSGSLDAQIGTLTIFTAPTCIGTGDQKEADEKLVCDSISSSLTYEDGTLVREGDMLDAGESKTMKYTLTYQPTANVAAAVNINELGSTIIYVER